MGIDLLVIAVGCSLALTSVLLSLRDRRGTRIALNSLRGRGTGPERRTSTRMIFGLGLTVAVVGGAQAQVHHIGWWALALVFIPIWLVQVVPVWTHNRRIGTAEAFAPKFHS